MPPKLWIALIFVTVTLARSSVLQAQTRESVVAIFGDLHEEVQLEDKILAQMRARGVTDIIGQGDLILYGGIKSETNALAKLTPQTGVDKNHIYLVPGNWEDTLNDPATVNVLLKQFGQLVVEDYDKTGYLQIDDFKMRVGHFPQHSIPTSLLPPAKTMVAIHGQITLIDTLARHDFPDQTTRLEIFSHTHVGGIYFDSTRGLWILNPGDLESLRKNPGEPQAYAILYPKSARVLFIEANSGAVLREVHLDDPDETCAHTVCNLNPN